MHTALISTYLNGDPVRFLPNSEALDGARGPVGFLFGTEDLPKDASTFCAAVLEGLALGVVPIPDICSFSLGDGARLSGGVALLLYACEHTYHDTKELSRALFFSYGLRVLFHKMSPEGQEQIAKLHSIIYTPKVVH